MASRTTVVPAPLFSSPWICGLSSAASLRADSRMLTSATQPSMSPVDPKIAHTAGLKARGGHVRGRRVRGGHVRGRRVRARGKVVRME